MTRTTEKLLAILTAREVDPLLLMPSRLGQPSSWWGHVPFAHLMVAETKPRQIVELGTHHGVSFGAFCNAVQRHSLSTRCYAIDTWRGDAHVGFYDDGLYESVSAAFQEQFSAFATLIRKSFDEAAASFPEGSIDLLHIDGMHTYEAVRHDFETWRPKLSHRGIVLFHDTTIHHSDFGVWRFWNEVKDAFPSFEFYHSCGLGVLAVGSEVPGFIADIIDMDDAIAVTFREHIAALGERWIAADERIRAQQEVAELKGHVAAVEAARVEDRAVAQQELAQLRLEMATRDTILHDAEAQQATLNGTLTARLGEVLNERSRVAALEQQADRLRRDIEAIRRSASWRIMGPYRVVARSVKRHVLGPLLGSPEYRQRLRDMKCIANADAFDAAFYRGRNLPASETDDALLDYLATSRAAIPRAKQHGGAPLRRPMPGFHPLIYAERCATFDEARGEDPLAHYLRTGRPNGPWCHQIITVTPETNPEPTGLRLLLHGHFHYPELLDDFLRRLARNATPTDLLLTTSSEAAARKMRVSLAAAGRIARIEIVPNRGRDIGPLLMHFAEVESYDLLGHLHGKRSPQQLDVMGGNWREFLWEHMLGGAGPSVDVVAAAFAADPALGLVFPEDPHLNHWDMNHRDGEKLAARMDLQSQLPNHFEFPKGTMFWIRPSALRPLAAIGWDWDDFPEEPLPGDGTLLHTLERFVPFAAERAGYGYATVLVPGCRRLPHE